MSKAVSLLVARETQTWIEALYENGAVTVETNGSITLNGNVRELIGQMHHMLAAGDTAKMDQLDKMFDDAMAATCALGVNMGTAVLSI